MEACNCKTCSICNKQLSVDSFFRHRQTRDGLYPYCKQCNSEKRKAWRQRNRDRANAQSLEYVRRNPQLRRKWTSINRDRHREERREQARRTTEKQLASHAKNEGARRARKRMLPSGNDAAIAAIYRRAKSEGLVVCHYCKAEIPFGRRHVDHAIPLARGGSHLESNLVIACSTCNLAKGTRTADEFFAAGGVP
jgi:5-methylcytosine-specific restriction endonuclease McrA